MDNVTITSGANSTPPSGTVVGTDEVTIGGTLQHVQRVKLVDGTDGGTALIGGDAANGLDVDVTRIQGTVTATISSGSVAVVDGGSSLTVDTPQLPSALISGRLDVNVGNTPTVTSNQGTAAAQSSRWPTFISDGSAERIGQQTMANSLPVTVASNQSAIPTTISSGSVVVADGGGSLTIDGTVNQGAAAASSGKWPVLITDGVDDANVASASSDGLGISSGLVTVPFNLTFNGTNWDRMRGTIANGVLVDVSRISSGSVVVADGGGSLTVDQGAPAIGANAWPIAVTDTSNVIVKAGDTSNNAVRVNVVAGSGGGVTHTDDAAFTPGTDDFVPAGGTYRSVRDLVDDNDAGVFAMTQRRAMLSALETPNADSAMDDVNDAVRVNVVAGGGAGGGTSISDDSAFTVGTTAFTPAGGTYRSVRDPVDDNDGGAFAMTQKRAMMVAIETPNADSAMDDTNDAVRVNVVAGSGGGVSHTDEAAFTEGTTAFVPVGGVYNPTRTDPVGEDWAAAALITKQRALHVNLRDDIGNEFGTSGSPIRIDPTGVTTQPVSGTVNVGTFPDNEPFNLNQYGGIATTLGQKAMSASMPVVIASDQSAVTVSGTVTANQGTAAAQTNRWPTFISDGTAERIGQQTMANSLPVAIASNQSAISVTVSSGSVVIADGGGSITVDTPQLPSALVGNRLDVNVGNTPTVTANAGTGDFLVVTGHTTNEAFKEANAVGGQLDDTGTTAATENNIAPVRITAQRAFHANLRNDGGTEIGTATTPIRTDPTGTTTQPVSATDLDIRNLTAVNDTVVANAGTGTFTTQDTSSLVDNAGFTDGTSRVLPAGFYFDETAGTALTENDIAAARIDSKRALIGVIEDETTRGRRATVTVSNALKVDGSAVTQPISGTVTANQGTAAAQSSRWPIFISDGSAERLGQQTMANSLPVTMASNQSAMSVTISSGSVAIVDGGGVISVDGQIPHDSPFTLPPVIMGATHVTMGDTAPENRVSDDTDATRLSTTDGALYVIPTGPQTWTYHATGVQTGAQVHAAPGTGLKIYITDIHFSIGAATSSSIKLLNNGGSDIWGPHYLENINGRGLAVHFGTPLPAAANTRLDVTTTGAATQTVDIQGFIAPG